MESGDEFFDENRYLSIHIPNDVTSNTNVQEIDQSNTNHGVNEQTLDENVRSTSSSPRRSKRERKEKYFGQNFHVYLVEGSIMTKFFSYIFNVEEDHLTLMRP